MKVMNKQQESVVEKRQLLFIKEQIRNYATDTVSHVAKLAK